MRVLLLNTQMEPAGAQKAMLELALSLKQRGNEVSVGTMYDKSNYVSLFQERYGLDIIDLEMKNPGTRNPITQVWYFTRGIIRLYSFMRANHPQVVQTFTVYSNILGPIIAWLARVPVRVSSQRNSLKDRPIWLLWLDRLVANSSLVNRMVAVSEGTRQFAIEKEGINPDKLVTIRNGIDIAGFKISLSSVEKENLRQELGIEVDARIILTVARLHPQKGHKYLIRAIPNIAQSFPQARFLFVGEGELGDELRAQVEEFDLTNYVSFLGVREDIPQLLAISDLFLLPSLWEGLPNTVLEAMAMKVPVIATAVDGSLEVIDNGKTGLLVSPADSAALEHSVCHLLRDESLQASLKEAALEKINSEFSIDATISSCIDLYHRLIFEKLDDDKSSQRAQFSMLGVKIDALTVQELHRAISRIIRKSDRKLILNVNVHALNLAFQKTKLRNFLNHAHLVFCDGSGVILGAKILGYHFLERITYADWAWQLAEFAEQREFTFFFLGAYPGVATKAAESLKKSYPNLRIVGIHHGYFDKTPGSAQNEAVIAEINAVKPNILIVGFGMPLQERWLMENWERIDANVALTGGAVFDYVSGELQRAPRWMTNNGLEWLGRLIIEPRRLWKRYLIGNPVFFWRILLQKVGLHNLDN